MDMMMPGLGGLDATRQIREYQSLRQTPIVAVSAYGADEYEPSAGRRLHRIRPDAVRPEALSRLIERLLAT